MQSTCRNFRDALVDVGEKVFAPTRHPSIELGFIEHCLHSLNRVRGRPRRSFFSHELSTPLGG
jgi:hypothetical protein